jgi:hypothetical protein
MVEKDRRLLELIVCRQKREATRESLSRCEPVERAVKEKRRFRREG